MCVRVADVGADRSATVAIDDARQPALDLAPRVCPGDLDETAVTLDERTTQPVRILVQLLERAAFRTDESLREHVVAITADPRDHTIFDRDLQPTRRLTQRTRAIDDFFGGCHRPIVP